jgi:hypothetical protein
VHAGFELDMADNISPRDDEVIAVRVKLAAEDFYIEYPTSPECPKGLTNEHMLNNFLPQGGM